MTRIDLWKIGFCVAVGMYRLYSLLTSSSVEEEDDRPSVRTNKAPILMQAQAIHQEATPQEAIPQEAIPIRHTVGQLPSPKLAAMQRKKQEGKEGVGQGLPAIRSGSLTVGIEKSASRRRKFFRSAFLMQELVASKFI
ncbi:hypothetical protein [Candidatus Cardinium hertigii]|uniref:Uncharacterized protein n=1 Tax=Candidatus Cardinium hertigii TaxID=247481 RepID=A0A2Z3LB60_9BACT|nr:hypothetical protein [Candidatus Cardinium hertigii]AWN81492.1 hypothetical protein DK880_00156 [Candidatus Cardinium hertigii]